MLREEYAFPAVVDFAEDGISIEFPDLPGCFSCAENEQDIPRRAKEALGLHLWSMEDDNEEIPAATPLSEVSLEPNQATILVDVWMPVIRERHNNRAVNKTVTLPSWLDKLAKASGLNYSATLQEAIKLKLNI